MQNGGGGAVTITFEVDKAGNGTWSTLQTATLAPHQATQVVFAPTAPGEWIRVKSDKAATLSVQFTYASRDSRSTTASGIFAGLSRVQSASTSGGLLYGLGGDRRALGMAAVTYLGEKQMDVGYYELTGEGQLVRKTDAATESVIRDKFTIPQQAVTIDGASVLVVDDKGRRWRLPLGNEAYTNLTNAGTLRICREVATERDLFNCHGTFYELPAENADGYAKIRPVASHNLRIHDYASYRGLLVMTGIDLPTANNPEHIIVSDDKRAAVWAGAIDDLWQLGKPTGHGGPWKNTSVRAGEASDPYLIGFYDRRSLTLSHGATAPVTFTLEADPVGTGVWMPYKTLTVAPGQPLRYPFPAEFQARWIRFKTDKPCQASALLEYK